ncbi:hypothetical protein [Oleiharenicola lentus]|uniref:hypothetical protein n=1 Tax=Oleiharenicola lentus TaxID=2508720 RepID=UPI003F6756F8
MRLSLFLLLLGVATVTHAEVDQRALLGTWFRTQDRSSIEITFARDGAFSENITVGAERRPAGRVDGRWAVEGDMVKITLPSIAPMGVSPRQDRVVTWRIEKVSGANLSVAENGSKEFWQFTKKK